MKNELTILNKNNLEDKIYYIRGQKVMIDSDLAEIYGYTTKAFNQQVQRNIDKFDDDFRFQLTTDEVKLILRSQNVTSSWGGRRYNIYAFTEQGIYMLMTILKGELVTKQSKILIRLFKEMKDYIIENDARYLFYNEQLLALSKEVNNNTEDIKNIKEKMATKDDIRYIMENFIDKDSIKSF